MSVRRSSLRAMTRGRATAIYAVLIVASLAALFPIWRVLSVSVRPGNIIASTSLELLPSNAGIQHYVAILTEHDFLQWLWNSILVSVPTALGATLIASSSAYVIARRRFRGRKGILMLLLGTQVLPGGAMMMGTYLMIIRLGLSDSYVGLSLAYMVAAVPLAIWLLKGYYEAIPFEIEQAAMVDGCSRFGAFIRVVVPMSLPGLTVVFLLGFMGAWNDFMYARLLLQSSAKFTWPLGLSLLRGRFYTLWGLFAAGAVMVSIPSILLFFRAQRNLSSGLTAGGISD